MKFRLVIPDQDLQPLPGETPFDAIHRAVIGRELREEPVEPKMTDEDRSQEKLPPEAAGRRALV